VADYTPAPGAESFPVRVYSMGRFALVKDGEVIGFTGRKSPRKALELLEALIALGGRDVHLTHLMCAVWAESESRDQRKLFDNTLHRLRKVLGHDEALLLSNAKLTLNHEVCWVDAWAFQRLAGRVLSHGVPDHDVANRAVALYQGHFLQGELELPWLISYRDRLHSTFLRLVMKHGERLEAQGAWLEAAQFYEFAIERDNLVERLYQRLMHCHHMMAEHAEAMRTYRRCRQLLSVVLGVQPSPETERLRAGVQSLLGDPSGA